ncbi:MAG: hypothetical protein ACI841_002446 [Planctomycetota bacterium]|jgi:hypothetical protein
MTIRTQSILLLCVTLLSCAAISTAFPSTSFSDQNVRDVPSQQMTKGLRLELGSIAATQATVGPWEVEVSIMNTTDGPLEIIEPLLPEGRSLMITLSGSANEVVYATPAVKGSRFPATPVCVLPAGHRLSAMLSIADEKQELAAGSYRIQATYQPRGQTGVLRSAHLPLELTESK